MIKTSSVLGRVDLISPRPGLRRYGVPPGGAWDIDSHRALQLLGCELIWEAATTAFGGLPFWSFEVVEPGTLTFLGLSGAVRRNGASMRLPSRLRVAPGDQVEVTAGPSGMRLLVGGHSETGRDAQLVEMPGPADAIAYIPMGDARSMSAVVSPQQDRIGIRLAGDFAPPPPLARSEPSVQGAIQWVSGGLLIHGPDGPTTGGYPKAGVVAQSSMTALAQARPGERLQFEPIPLEEALERRTARIRLIEEWAERVRLGLSVE